MLKKIRQMLKTQEGFTLVELMIVVVILGILAGVGVQQYGKIQQKASDAANDANVKIIISAANMYLMAEENPDDLVGSGEEFDAIQELVSKQYLESGLNDYTLTVTKEKPTSGKYVNAAIANYYIQVKPWYTDTSIGLEEASGSAN